jgi:hypothetical protein
MRHTPQKRIKRLAALAAALTLLALDVVPAAANPVADHRLHVRLRPDAQRLEGEDHVHVQPGGATSLGMVLGPQAVIHAVEIDGTPRPVRRTGAHLVMDLAPAERTGTLVLRLAYSARFDDRAPVLPLNTDNPGYGVTGTISPDGVLLLGGAGWYPSVAGARESLTVEVETPAGMLAVTAGRSLGTATTPQTTLSRWQVDHAVEPLALSAGFFEVTRRQAGRVEVSTYFLPASRHLASAYLDASVRYLALYEDLFGPYAYPKFAVVENFFPTGYGFPSYTLLGTRVLHLPFIIGTSLGHEIAHCWWGNGVLVDGAAGNWSEGLTSYVAEHLFEEQRSPAAAQEHRRQYLRNYADLVGGADDLALARFQSRTSPPTKTIGYDKGAMVFHMLRRRVGDAVFWESLRRLYAQRRFQPTAWSHFQEVFEASSGQDLSGFFRQWVARPGAPRLALQGVVLEPALPGFRLTGTVVQAEPAYSLDLDLAIRGPAGEAYHSLAVNGTHTPFDLALAFAPTRLEADPHTDLFRRLEPSEIPPAVNRLRGAAEVVVARAADFPPAAGEMLLAALGVEPRALAPAAALPGDLWRHRDLLVLGRPAEGPLRAALDREVRATPGGLHLQGIHLPEESDAYFAVLRHPLDPARVMAVFDGRNPTALTLAAPKIAHYGRYSYLAFSQGANLDKGLWPPRESPLQVQFPATPSLPEDSTP